MKKLAFLSIFLTLFLSFVSVSATTVYVDPSSIKDPDLEVGDTFDIKINVDEVVDLYSYDMKLSYDTSYLNAINTQPGFLNEPIQEIKNEIDLDAGEVWLAITSQNPAEPKSGSGTLATITFKVEGRGISSLDLNNVQLVNFETELMDSSVSDGSFDNTGEKISNQLNSAIVGLIFLILIVALYLVFVRRKKVKKRKKSK